MLSNAECQASEQLSSSASAGNVMTHMFLYSRGRCQAGATPVGDLQKRGSGDRLFNIETNPRLRLWLGICEWSGEEG